MKYKIFLLASINIFLLMSCQQNPSYTDNADRISIMVLAPGHFHAALIQKNMYPELDSQVFVYAPKGPEVEDYLSRIAAYNSRSENPTHWKENVYLGDDFFSDNPENALEKGQIVGQRLPIGSKPQSK